MGLKRADIIEVHGSQIELRPCPGCGYRRHPAQFRDAIGVAVELCSVCRETGATYRAGSKRGETTMGQTTCPECGKEVKERGLGVHRARKHGVRKDNGAAPAAAAPSVPARRGDPRLTPVARPRGEVQIVTNGMTLPEAVARITQERNDRDTALRILSSLTDDR